MPDPQSTNRDEQPRHLDDLIRTLDRLLHEQLPTGRFMAAHLVEVTADRRRLRIANAGMPDGLLLETSGAWRPLPSRGLALGIAPGQDADGQVETLMVRDGTRLLLATDGLLEASDPAGALYGLERLAADYAALLARGAPLEALLTGLERHAGGRALEDDVLVLELVP